MCYFSQLWIALSQKISWCSWQERHITLWTWRSFVEALESWYFFSSHGIKLLQELRAAYYAAASTASSSAKKVSSTQKSSQNVSVFQLSYMSSQSLYKVSWNDAENQKNAHMMQQHMKNYTNHLHKKLLHQALKDEKIVIKTWQWMKQTLINLDKHWNCKDKIWAWFRFAYMTNYLALKFENMRFENENEQNWVVLRIYC
jgi:hypothetical protein